MDLHELSKEARRAIHREQIRRALDDAIQRARHSAMKRLIEEEGMNDIEARNHMEKIVESLSMLKDKMRLYVDGVVRWYTEGYFDPDNEVSCSLINRILRAVYNSPLEYELNKDFSLEREGKQLTPDDVLTLLGADEDRDQNNDFDPNDYQIKEIESFKEIEKLNNLFKEWCIATDESAYNLYTENGKYKLYLAFRDDYKDMKKVLTDTHPRDAYGYSIIALIVDTGGNITTTSRWNSTMEGEKFLTEKEAKELMKKAKLE